MAENIIKSRVMLKYDTLANWNSSNLTLKKGEVAIAEVPNNTSNSGLTPPAIGIKVGDGTKTFSQLGWIQAVAGDVYAWAKAATKPNYSASEISGLSEYISGEINDHNTLYRITTGTGTNANKYLLESREVGTDTWTLTSTIDLTSMVSRISTLETWADTSTPLISQIGSKVTYEIEKLDVTDTAVSHQFVTAVSETDGKISVSRSALAASDIASGSLGVARGGTGKSTLASGEVLVGNGTGAVNTRPIDTTVTTNSTALITSGAVKTYVDGSLSGLNGAMHFIGVVTSAIANNSTSVPTIEGRDSYEPQAGDVVLSGSQEFVWTGSNWHLLGDEGSYAVKGSITKSDLATALQNEITGKLNSATAQTTYVTKNGTDRLMTVAEGTKLSGIEAGAEVNIIEAIKIGGTTANVDSTDRSVSLGAMAAKSSVSESDLDSALATKISNIPTGLHAIAYDGDVGHLAQSTTYLVIDCGNASDKLYN